MTSTAALDRATGRTSPTEAGGSPVHGGPFGKDLHETAPALWVAVALMCLGTALIGGGVVALSKDTTAAVWLFVAGVALGIVGGALGLLKGIMSNVS